MAKPLTKPGKHGTLYLYRITYKDATDSGAPEFTSDKWAYSLEHIDDITEGWADDGWKILSVARVPADGGSMHRAIKHRTRESSRVVADFSTLPDLISHAASDLGATHVAGSDSNTIIYFPRGGQYPYEEATVWRKNGYWHAQGPGSRTGVARLPEGARPIGTGRGRRAAEASGRRHGSSQSETELISQGKCPWETASGIPWTERCGRKVVPGHLYCSSHERDFRDLYPNQRVPMARPARRVEDYIAVDRNDRRTAGPFKHYGDARDAAGPADVVKFVPSGRTVRSDTFSHGRKPTRPGWYLRYSDGEHQGPHPGGEQGAKNSAQNLSTPEMPVEAVYVAPKRERRWWGGRASESPSGRMRDGDQLPLPGSDDHDGEQYAQEQLESDYFQEWIWNQMVDGSKLPPDARIPLETPADFQRLARRMLQDLEFDTRRQYRGSLAFFEGMRRRLNDPHVISYLAEELMHVDEQLKERPAPAPKKKKARKKKR